MSLDSPEIVSGVLNREQIEAEASHLARILADIGVGEVTVEHWFGKQEVIADQLDQAFKEGFKDSAAGSPKGRVHLSNFDSNLPKRRFYLGDSDFVIRLPDEGTKFEFCHEDELHVSSPNESLRNIFRSRWLSKGYNIRENSAV